MDEHRIYTGNHYSGSRMLPFGKCRCGAVLEGAEEIEEHRKLEEKP